MTREEIAAILRRVQSWPLPRQREAARLLLAFEAHANSETAPPTIQPSEDPDLIAILEEAGQDDIASDAEVEAVFVRRQG